MPRVKSQDPESLKKLCVEFVASNLDRIHLCNPSSEDEINNKCDQEATLSQFDKLPSVLMEEICHCLLERRKLKLKKQSFELLITPHLTNLDFSIGQLTDVPYILNLAALRCRDVQTVRMVCSRSCVDIFVHFCAMKFERLRVLNISETDAGDNCLQILGMYCKDLRELKVAHCMAITDAGIEGLCVSINRLGKEDQRLGQCKSIETLIIDGTSITKKGLETALLNLPFLKHLSTDLWLGPPVHFLAQMHQPDLNRKQLKDIRKYSLESLYLGNDTIDYPSLFHVQPDYTRGSLGLVASLCPLVTSVNIDLIAGLTDSEILGLLSLKSVNELGINGEYVRFRTVSFEGGIVPLLKGFGSSLKVLVLKAFLGDINVRAIIEFCPKLQSLKLNENNRYSTTVSFKEDAKPYHSKRSRIERKPLVLKNLEKLLVVRPYYVENAEAQVEEQISSEDLLCLISSPSLIDIEIRDCPNLTDCVFESASEIHQFLSLEKLTLFKCNSLTRKGIDVVMNNQTPLKTIDVRSCGNITDGDIALLISNARSEKWQLSVEYVNENGKRIKM